MHRPSAALLLLASVLFAGCSKGPEKDTSAAAETAPPAAKVALEAANAPAVMAEKTPVSPERAAADAAFRDLVRAGSELDPDAWPLAEERLRTLGVSAVPTLAAALADRERSTREFAAMFLAQLGPEVEAASAELLAVLDDESAFVRVNAVSSLSYFPDHAPRLVPVCLDLLGSSDENIRITAAVALGNLGEQAAPAALEPLRKALGDAEPRVQAAAAMALGNLGPAASAAVPQLRRLESARDEELRGVASAAIERIESGGQSATDGQTALPVGFEQPQLLLPILE